MGNPVTCNLLSFRIFGRCRWPLRTTSLQVQKQLHFSVNLLQKTWWSLSQKFHRSRLTCKEVKVISMLGRIQVKSTRSGFPKHFGPGTPICESFFDRIPILYRIHFSAKAAGKHNTGQQQNVRPQKKNNHFPMLQVCCAQICSQIFSITSINWDICILFHLLPFQSRSNLKSSSNNEVYCW